MKDNAAELRPCHCPRQSARLLAGNRLPEAPVQLDPDIPLHVLTQKRLRMTLGNLIPVLMKLEPDKVNSIFRPTLPAEKIWEIRRAW